MQFPKGETSRDRTIEAPVPTDGACFASLQTHDPAEFELALRPWELMARPETAGTFRHALSMYRARNCFIYREEFDLPMLTLGLSPKDMLGIGVAGNESGVKFWGIEPGEGSCPMVLSGPLEVTWKSAHSQHIAFIDVDILQRTVSEEEYERLIEFGILRHAPIFPETRLRLMRFLDRTLRACQTCLGLPAKDQFHAMVQEELISLLGLIAWQSLEKRNLPSYSARRRAVSIVCDVLASDPVSNAKMSDLCQIAGMSERSLQYAFRAELGISARDFMTMRRLHAARRCLRLADPAASSVSKIAMDHGFFELGRFAGRYRACFGELPSETLRKCSFSPGF